jgi:hypothetical protein
MIDRKDYPSLELPDILESASTTGGPIKVGIKYFTNSGEVTAEMHELATLLNRPVEGVWQGRTISVQGDMSRKAVIALFE